MLSTSDLVKYDTSLVKYDTFYVKYVTLSAPERRCLTVTYSTQTVLVQTSKHPALVQY